MVAVAISVGFAGRLVKMDWISGQKLIWPPSPDEIVQLFRLATGIFVVVSGWEWYHRDLKDRPLNYPWRFYIDVAVVILTILFLFSSDKEQVWLSSLVLIFGLYVAWDGFSLIEFRGASVVVRENIWSAFITNVLWLVFFVVFFAERNNHISSQNDRPLATCLFVLLAAASLRALSGLRVPSALDRLGLVVRFVVLGALAAFYHYVPSCWPA